MKRFTVLATSSVFILSACGGGPKENTLEAVSNKELNYQPVEVATPKREDAINSYRSFLKHAENKNHYGDALRRLADLELELGEAKNAQEDEKTTLEGQQVMLSSIEHYKTYLKTYPDQETNDLILYQLAKAYSLNGDQEKALEAMDTIVNNYPDTQYIDEVQFRRGEILFVFGDYREAESAYKFVVANKKDSLFYEKSLYKLGWSRFKQSKYFIALEDFFSLLDIKQKQGHIHASGISEDITKSELDFISDTLRVVSFALSYKDGTKTIRLLFANRPDRLYQPLLYKNLGELYIKKDRIGDGADVFLSFTSQYPNSPLAPDFHTLAIEAYKTGGFPDKVLESKKTFVQKYGVNTPFWLAQTSEDKEKINSHLKQHIRELANYYHAQARKSKKANAYSLPAYWYRQYLMSFPEDADAPMMNFLLAETHFDGKQYSKALIEYEKTAYKYQEHSKSAEAGYAALITYDRLSSLATPDQKKKIHYESIQSSIRFSNKFPQHKHAPAVMTKTAENLFAINNYTTAGEFAQRIIDRKDIKQRSFKKTAWIVLAHSRFELKDYPNAELAYIEAIKFSKINTKQHKELSDKLAASIYKQGEMQRDKGLYALAAFQFLRVGTVVPNSPIRATADYDAATMYLKEKDWKNASKVLENFRKRYPNHKTYGQGISEKLAFIYTETSQFGKAAAEIAILAAGAKTVSDQRKLKWQAAEMYGKAGKKAKANKLYIEYINRYPKPFAQYIEAHYLVSEYYRNSKQYKTWSTWLHRTVKAEKAGGKQRNERTNFIAAKATLYLTRPIAKQFKQAKLTVPLKKSLKKKKKLMEKALDSYKQVMSYQIAELTTESTYQVGEIYHHFAVGILESQRPKKLSGEELEQYELILEEQAYPFEEKAIDIHKSNVERTRDGIYDNWIKKSMKILAELQPVRYSKKEKIQNYVLLEY